MFVGGSFENLNWLAAFAIQPPSFGAICLFTCGAIDPMKFAVQIPMFVVPGGDFANWLFAHTLPLY